MDNFLTAFIFGASFSFMLYSGHKTMVAFKLLDEREINQPLLKKSQRKISNFSVLGALLFLYPIYLLFILLANLYFDFQKPWEYILTLPNRTFLAPAFFLSLGFSTLFSLRIFVRDKKLLETKFFGLTKIMSQFIITLSLIMYTYLLWTHSKIIENKVYINKFGSLKTKIYNLNQINKIQHQAVIVTGQNRSRTIHIVSFTDGETWTIDDDNISVQPFIDALEVSKK